MVVPNTSGLKGIEAAAAAGVVAGDAGRAVSASFATDGGRTLDVVIAIRDDGSYEILSWKATTEWNEEGAGETLWSGSPSLG